MAYIRYTIGHENSVIIESENYEDSIFAEQYRQAVSLIHNFVARDAEDSLRIISFCGDRGSGKSSCMESVIKLMTDLSNPENGEARHFVSRHGYESLVNTTFEIPEIIDPSFFDEKNNILELIIGQLYCNLQKYEYDHRNSIDRNICNSVYDAVANVRNAMLTIHGDAKHSFNEFSDLSVLSSAVSLKKSIRNLIHDYLKLIHKDRIIFIVDDIDLNIPGAYDMCEQIRKYLCMPESIVMISFKYEQLHSVVFTAMRKSFDNDSIPMQEIDDMANRYLDKFVPNAQRIHMPVTYNLCNRTLRVYDKNGHALPVLPMTIKYAVVNLIFNKTRFLFYNSKGGISPIVPNNLRDLFQLIGMLWNMPDLPPRKGSAERSNTLEANKHVFKMYFFKYWTKCLDKEYLEMVQEWTQDTPYTILNKNVVRWLSSAFRTELRRQYDEDTEDAGESVNKKYASSKTLIEQITAEENFSYNVSIGDVFFIINLLEQDILSPQKEKILFFIKSYYSILLFENYDIVTEYDGELAPIEQDLSGLYRTDHRFDHTNDLQRLVGGSFFTYRPGELIRNSLSGLHYDSRIIKGTRDIFNSIFKGCRTCIESYDKIVSELEGLKVLGQDSDEIKNQIQSLGTAVNEMEKQFRLAEFLIFTISRSIPQKEVKYYDIGDDDFRKNVAPYALTQFNQQIGYYVFDILNPFYVLCNPKYSYSRFDKLLGLNEPEGQLYYFALCHKFSLLNNMIDKVCGDSPSADTHNKDLKGWINQLQSDSVIRNAEVLMAMFENMVSVRDTEKSSSGLAKLSAFYKGISDSGMATHKVGSSPDAKPYHISFKFLEALTYFIDNDLTNEKTKAEFTKIFDGASDDSGSSKESTPASGIPVRVNLSKKAVKKSNPVNLPLHEKGSFISRLKNYLGSEPLTANEIIEKIKELDGALANLDNKSMRGYVTRKKGNAPFTMNQLADYILKEKERFELWSNLLNILDINAGEMPF